MDWIFLVLLVLLVITWWVGLSRFEWLQDRIARLEQDDLGMNRYGYKGEIVPRYLRAKFGYSDDNQHRGDD